jgi:hypothetical protein
VTSERLTDFTARIAPLLGKGDLVDLVRRDDELLVVAFTDDPDELQERVREAGFDVDRPDPVNELPPLGGDDPLLAPLIPSLVEQGVPIASLAFDRIDLDFSDVVLDGDLAPPDPAPEGLPCPTADGDERVATGYGQGSSDPLKPTSDLTEEENQVAAAARSDAVNQVRNFLASTRFRCEAGCEPTVRMLLGSPVFDQIPLEVPLLIALLGRVPWELYVECTPLGSLAFEFVGVPVKPRKRPLKCGESYTVGGTGKGMAEELTAQDPNQVDPKSPRITGAPREVRRRVLQEARNAAVEQMYTQIEKAIAGRPDCPTVRCPDPRIVVRVGFPKGAFRFELTDVYEVFRAIGTAFVEWQVEITCGRED